MPDEHARRLLTRVRAHREDMLELLRRLVEAESPSSTPETHRGARTVLTSALADLGFAVRSVRGSGALRHVYARPGDRSRDRPRQLLVGHYDTVWPAGTVAKRPFSVDGDIVRGPGAFDMKGGLAQMLVAFAAIRELGLELPLEPVVFVNADEEIGSRTSTRIIRLLARRVRRAFVLEPAMGEHGLVKTRRKGIGRYTVTVHGKAAHAGLDPEGGASAILELSHVIQALFAMNDAERGISVNVGTVDGGIQPNVIAPHSTAVVDVRVPTVEDGRRVEAAIFAITPSVPGVRLRIEGGIGRPAMEATPANRALWRQAHCAAHALGIELDQCHAGGGSDGNTTSQYTATLDGLGPVGGGAHAEHEFLYLDRTLERAALLALLLLAPPSGSEPAERRS